MLTAPAPRHLRVVRLGPVPKPALWPARVTRERMLEAMASVSGGALTELDRIWLAALLLPAVIDLGPATASRLRNLFPSLSFGETP